MKTKNVIGKILFAVIGVWIIFIVLYPITLSKLFLTDKPVEDLGLSEYALLALGFVFFWGSRKFITISNYLIEYFKRKFPIKQQ